MASRWPTGGMHSHRNFGPMNRPFFQPRVPGPFSPQTCWVPLPPANQWQPHPPAQRNSYRPQKSSNNNNNRKTHRKDPVFIDYCDVCDRGFQNLAKKAEHFKQHITCDEPGCSFEAHFKIVAIHKQNLHGPNALKIKLDSPEDIQRWRMERKRKYPTLNNVKMKAKKAAEEKELGNVLGNKYFGKVKQRKKPTGHRELDNITTPPPAMSKLPEPKPLNLLFCDPADTLENSISSDEEQGNSKVISNVGNSVGLGSLMQSYASDSEEETSEILLSSKTEESQSPVKTEISRTVELGHQDKTRQEFSIVNKAKSNSRDWRSKQRKSNILNSKRPSLLEMLLAPEIRRERNHILQCVRFIVKNGFFEDANTK